MDLTRYQYWRKEETAFLEENYHRLGKPELIDRLKRPWTSIKPKARNLRLSREPSLLYPEDYTDLSLTAFEIGFLVGLIEGEGTVGIIQQRKDPLILHPYLQISNTKSSLLHRCQELLQRGVVYGPYFAQDKAKGYAFKIATTGRLYRILRTLEPYLLTKRRHAQLVLEFLEINAERHLLGRKRDSNGKYAPKLVEYTRRQLEIYNELRELNCRGKKGIG